MGENKQNGCLTYIILVLCWFGLGRHVNDIEKLLISRTKECENKFCYTVCVISKIQNKIMISVEPC